VTVTDHGTAVARLVPLDKPRAIDRLIDDGVISPAQRSKRHRSAPRINASGTISPSCAVGRMGVGEGVVGVCGWRRGVRGERWERYLVCRDRWCVAASGGPLAGSQQS